METKNALITEFKTLQKKIPQNLNPEQLYKTKIYNGGLLRSKETNKYITQLLSVTRFKFLANTYAGWGLNQKTVEILKKAINDKKNFLFLEDGFIRSIYPISAKSAPSEAKSGISFCIDTKGFYFDCSSPTDLEILLNSEPVTKVQQNQAKDIIDTIVKNKISKYNIPRQIAEQKEEAPNTDKVIVIDQSRGDQSLILGNAHPNVFDEMLRDAINENPNSEIIFKIHPDNIYSNKNITTNFKNITIDTTTNPIDLLTKCRKVYVATSQLGLEALFLKKDVVVYGLPFYAGWGLTTDKQQCHRRTRKLTIEELFYITYIKYVKYINPYSSKEGTVLDAIHFIQMERDKFSHSI